MTKYARLKKDRVFIKKTTRYKEKNTVTMPAGTIVQVTVFDTSTSLELTCVSSSVLHSLLYKLVCGEWFIHIFIIDSDKWLEFLND